MTLQQKLQKRIEVLNDCDQDLIVSGDLSPQDYGAGLYLHHRPAKWIRVFYPALGLGYVTAIAFHARTHMSMTPLVVFMFPLFLVLLWRAAWFESQLLTAFGQDIGWRSEYQFTLNAEAIQVSSPQDLVAYPWSSLINYKQNRRLTLIYLGEHSFLLVPHRWFPSVEAAAWFQEQLQTHLGSPND